MSFISFLVGKWHYYYYYYYPPPTTSTRIPESQSILPGSTMSVNNIYQYSVLSALLYGICQQGSTVQTILSKGDHGLGMVSGLNGELVIIDGEVYHFPPNGKLCKVHSSDIVPFTMVTHFQLTFTKTLSSLAFGLLQQELSLLLPSKQNCFLSIHIEVFFQHIVCHVIPCQTVPHESLSELAK